MIIFKYLARRFAAYFFVLSFLLAFLSNFIEFFEKIVRVKDISAHTIVQYLLLNFLPTLFDLLPVAAWLGLCLVLKDIFQRNEWDLLQLLSYVPRRFFRFTFIIGLVLCTCSLWLYEGFVADMAFRAERFKQEHLKQAVVQKMVGKWFELEHRRFCFFNVLDLKTGRGKDLLLIDLTPHFSVCAITKAADFFVDFDRGVITIPEGMRSDVEEQKDEKIQTFAFSSPAFFSHLDMQLEPPTLYGNMRKIILYKHDLPFGVYNELLAQVCTRVGYYLQLLLYPLFTWCLFWSTGIFFARWLLAFSAYPIMVLIKFVGTNAVQAGFHALFILLLYLLVAAFVAFSWWRARRV